MKIYRPVLKDAILISWRNKSLWIFSFLAAFVTIGGSGALINKMFNLPSAAFTLTQWFGQLGFAFSHKFRSNFIEALVLTPSAILAIFLVFLVLGAIGFCVIYLAINCQASLILAADRLLEGQQIEIGKTYKEAKKHFGSLVWIYVTLLAIDGLLVLVLSPLTLKIMNPGAITTLSGYLVYIVAFIAYFVANLYIFFVGLFALNYRLLKKYSVRESLQAGFELFTQHWLASIEISVVLLLGSIVIFLSTGIASLVIYMPLSVLAFTFSTIGMKAAMGLTIVTMIALLAALWILMSTWLTTVINIAWVSFFEYLNSSKPVSKLVRLGNWE